MHKKIWKPITCYAMRFDGEGGGGSSAPVAPATPATPASPTTESQTPAEPAAPFKSFATQADFDREIQQAIKSHETKLTAKLTPAIRAQVEKEASMTAEQKVQAQLDALEADKKALAKEKVRIKVESLFASKGIAEADRVPMLDSIVDDNEEESLKRGQALISALEHSVNEQVKAQMKQVPPPDGGSGAGGGKEKNKAVEYAKSLADRRAASTKASNSALDFYIHGGKRV